MQLGTSSSNWRLQDNIDPHGNAYNCPRHALLLGDIGDLELVTYESSTISNISLSRLLTGIKERIRWLSRQLVAIESKLDTERNNIERSKLLMGELTDDELANNLIIYGNCSKYTDRYLLAARNRVVWLHSLLQCHKFS